MSSRVCDLPDWVTFLKHNHPLLVQTSAIGCPAYRLRRRYEFSEAARGFAPDACREMLMQWRASTAPHASIYVEYWKGVCAFLPIDEAAEAQCDVTYREAQRFHEGLRLECNGKLSEARELFLFLSDRNALAADRVCALTTTSGDKLLEGWLRYRGRINNAVIALQSYAIALSLCSKDTNLPTEAYTVFLALRLSAELGHTPSALALYRHQSKFFYVSTLTDDEIYAKFRHPSLIIAAREDVAAEIGAYGYVGNIRTMMMQENWIDKLPGLMHSFRFHPLMYCQFRNTGPERLHMYTAFVHKLPSPVPLDAIKLSLRDLTVQFTAFPQINSIGTDRYVIPTDDEGEYFAPGQSTQSAYANDAPSDSAINVYANAFSSILVPAAANLLTDPYMDLTSDKPQKTILTAAETYANATYSATLDSPSRRRGSASTDYAPLSSAVSTPPAASVSVPTNLSNDAAASQKPELLTVWRSLLASAHMAFIVGPPRRELYSETLPRESTRYQIDKCRVCGSAPADGSRLAQAKFIICTECFSKATTGWELSVHSIAMARDRGVSFAEHYAFSLLLLPYGVVGPLCEATRYELLTSYELVESALEFLWRVKAPTLRTAAKELCLLKYEAITLAMSVPSLSQYFHGRISKEEAETLVRRRNGSFLLRWSGTMAGVYFIVVSERAATAVRHVRIEPLSSGVSVLMPTEGNKEGEATKWAHKEFEGILEAVNAMQRPYRLKHPVGPSKYWSVLQQHGCV